MIQTNKNKNKNILIFSFPKRENQSLNSWLVVAKEENNVTKYNWSTFWNK
jgi:hypothetical protein